MKLTKLVDGKRIEMSAAEIKEHAAAAKRSEAKKALRRQANEDRKQIAESGRQKLIALGITAEELKAMGL